MKFFHNNNEYELIVLNLAGSKLYGNSTPSSDTDYRGVFIASKDSKLGILGTVEQLEGVDVWKSLVAAGLDLIPTDDIVIYELNRFVKLAAENNPNIIDTLCVPEKFCTYLNEKGKELINSKYLFLSSKLKFTFSGYAISQLAKVKSRDKYLTKYPRISEVLEEVKKAYINKLIDFNWICDNFGGSVADFVTNESPQNNIRLNSVLNWNSFVELSNIKEMNEYRRPRLLNYCHPKDLKGKQLYMDEMQWDPERYYREGLNEDYCLKELLETKASFRTFSPSMLSIYTNGNGIFTKEGKLKTNDPETIGEFVCLLSIDQNKFKSDSDFNQAMWEWKCKRNESRSELEAKFGYDTKNVSHLVRLMEQAKNIMINCDYNPVLIGEQLQLVKDVRAGSMTYEEVLEYGEKADKELDELYKTTKLQKKPDIKKINELVLKLQKD